MVSIADALDSVISTSKGHVVSAPSISRDECLQVEDDETFKLKMRSRDIECILYNYLCFSI